MRFYVLWKSSFCILLSSSSCCVPGIKRKLQILQILKVYNTPLNGQNRQSQRISRNQCLLRCGWYLCMEFLCMSVQYSAPCWTDGHTLSKTAGFVWISWQAFCKHCCNTSKSLIQCGYTEVFRCPHIVIEYLIQMFGRPWIRHEGPVNWPAWSLDLNLNPLDFWLWGHLKSLVYSDSVSDLEVLQQHVENASQEIWEKPGVF